MMWGLWVARYKMKSSGGMLMVGLSWRLVWERKCFVGHGMEAFVRKYTQDNQGQSAWSYFSKHTTN